MTDATKIDAEKIRKIHYFYEITSCLDKAFELVDERRLDIWDSVVAKTQTAGRGQMRRHWSSPIGNLYGALRLPMEFPFNSCAGSPAVGALCASALRSFGCPIFIKWPNDLILSIDDQFTKIGGILLEEKHNVIVVGIGINIKIAPAPEEIRDGASLPATCLMEATCGAVLPEPEKLWSLLVNHIFSVYKSGPVFTEIWKNMASELLLWKDAPVEIVDGDIVSRGIFCGLGDTGGALLSTPNGIEEKFCGSMRLCGTA